jgi:serine/threonine-protein kinase RsbW
MLMSDTDWLWQCSRVIPSNTDAGRRVLEELLGQLEALSWPEGDVFAIHLATEEALVNAIEHGNGYDVDKQVEFACRLSEDLVEIEIADEGPGFKPERLPDPTDPDLVEASGGRGVMLMKAFMTRVDFNDQGNRVVMEKHRSANSSAA